MMEQASELARFLTVSRRSAEEITKFLTLRTFSKFSATSVCLAEILDDGFVRPHSGFGSEKSTIATWGPLPINLHTPMTHVIREEDIVVIDSVEDLYIDYPILKSMQSSSTQWQTAVAWSILPFGAGYAHFDIKIVVDEEFKSFLQLVGTIVANHLARPEDSYPIPDFRTARTKSSEPKEMSDRQNVILEMLSRGMTNAKIAEKIGYSESLIRQETIAIYRNLGVSGRAELISSAG